MKTTFAARAVGTGARAGLLACFVLTAHVAHSAAPAWVRVGPEGGTLTAFATAPSEPATAYAGFIDGGIYRSDDRGMSWRYAGDESGRLGIFGLAVDGRSRETAYAASASFGVVKTVNGGAAWRPAAQGIQLVNPQPVVAVAADGVRSGEVYAATRTGAIYRSLDGAATWRSLPASAPRKVIALATDPHIARRLYATTQGGQVFASEDGGQHWRKIVPLAGAAAQALHVWISPRASNILYAIVYNGEVTRLRRSLDRGATWADFGDPSAGDASGFAIDPANGLLLYEGFGNGIRRSEDGGKTWLATGATPPGSQFRPYAFGGALLVQPFGSALWRSADRGASFAPVHGVRALTVLRVATAPGGRVFARAITPSSAMYRSEDRAASWQQLAPLDDQPFRSFGALFEVDPMHPETVYAGFTEALARSDDAGDHFAVIASPPCIFPSELAIDPSDSGNLYLSGDLRSASGCPRTGPDLCATYRKLGTADWECIDANLPGLGLPIAAVDPFDGHVLYAWFPEVIYRSQDRGSTWTLISDVRYLSALATDPTRPGVLYAGYLGGTGRSDDSGATWDLVSSGLPSQEYVASLVPDPKHAGRVYAVTPSNVWRSDDSGRHWRAAAPGLGDTIVRQVAIDPDDTSRLYAATSGGGLLRLKQRP